MMVLSGCGGEHTDTQILATIRPLEALIEPIVGEDVRSLVGPAASPHTYDPRPSAARAAASAKILFYGGEELDGWVAGLDSPRKVALFGLVPDSLRLLQNGIGDPHFWMDPLVVRAMLPALADTLCHHLPDNCERYRAHTRNFSRELTQLHDSLSTLTAELRGTSVLLAHPFLEYFARRYGLVVAGTIEEIPGSEPSPQDMRRMVQKARAAGARAIFTLPQHPSRAADAVSEATGIAVVELDPIGGANTYTDLLYFNAQRIRRALAPNASPD